MNTVAKGKIMNDDEWYDAERAAEDRWIQANDARDDAFAAVQRYADLSGVPVEECLDEIRNAVKAR